MGSRDGAFKQGKTGGRAYRQVLRVWEFCMQPSACNAASFFNTPPGLLQAARYHAVGKLRSLFQTAAGMGAGSHAGRPGNCE